MAEQTRTLELTQTQYKHIQSILNQDKPSKTRLSQEEKGMIRYMCNKWLEDYSGDEQDDKVIRSIIKKLK